MDKRFFAYAAHEYLREHPLIRSGAKYKLTADEAAKLVALVEKLSAPYGERFARMQMISVLEGLVAQKGLEPAAEGAAAENRGSRRDCAQTRSFAQDLSTALRQLFRFGLAYRCDLAGEPA